jgi:hypothetical protein
MIFLKKKEVVETSKITMNEKTKIHESLTANR